MVKIEKSCVSICQHSTHANKSYELTISYPWTRDGRSKNQAAMCQRMYLLTDIAIFNILGRIKNQESRRLNASFYLELIQIVGCQDLETTLDKFLNNSWNNSCQPDLMI